MVQLCEPDGLFGCILSWSVYCVNLFFFAGSLLCEPDGLFNTFVVPIRLLCEPDGLLLCELDGLLLCAHDGF